MRHVPNTPTFPCTWEGCSKRYTLMRNLTRHLRELRGLPELEIPPMTLDELCSESQHHEMFCRPRRRVRWLVHHGYLTREKLAEPWSFVIAQMTGVLKDPEQEWALGDAAARRLERETEIRHRLAGQMPSDALEALISHAMDLYDGRI